jgi:hypothetical protein
METMHPFFGNTLNAQSPDASSNPDECRMINRVLAQLDPVLDAPIIYAHVRKYIASSGSIFSHVRSFNPRVAIIECFLNWAFFVRELSLLKMQSGDIVEFCAFYFAPPTSYRRVARSCKRFIGSGTSTSVNPHWKPFYLPPDHEKNADKVVSALRGLFEYFSQHLPIKLTLPRGRAGVDFTDPENVSEDAILVERYFEILIDNTEIPVRRRPGCTSRDRQVFLFATCYLLNIPFALLAKSTQFFSMASFSVSGETWYLDLQSDEGLISRRLPDRYVAILKSYRISCGLSEVPSPSEFEPIFASWRIIRHVWTSLPVFEFMGTTVGRYVRRLIGITNKGERPATINQVSPGKVAHHRRTEKSLRVATDLFNEREVRTYSVRCCSSPLSLFSYSRGNSTRVEGADAKLISMKVQACLGTLEKSDIDTIRIFALYANSDYGKKNRYKVRGFEKLTLWCLFIRSVGIAELTDEDAEDFLRFCAAPPRHWCSNSIKPNAFADGRSNPDWRPFKLMVNENALTRRAVRIIDLCSAASQDLIDLASLNYNPFLELSMRLGSSKRH